jgi:hypothetical protein
MCRANHARPASIKSDSYPFRHAHAHTSHPPVRHTHTYHASDPNPSVPQAEAVVGAACHHELAERVEDDALHGVLVTP